MFNFDKMIDRRGTGCLKWDVADLFGLDRVEYPFWIADTDFPTVPEVVEALKKRCEHPLFGYNIPGPDCVPAVSRWYGRRHGWQFDPDTAFTSIGVVTVLRFTIQTLTNPGDKILIFTPGYDPFDGIITNTGRVVVENQLVRTADSYEIDFELLEKQLAGGVRAVILCNPHNPVGRVWTREELKRLSELFIKYDLLIMSDEVHGDISIHGSQYTPMGTFPEIQDRLAVYTAISKTFNLAGLQASCVVVPNEKLRAAIRAELMKGWIMSPNPMACVAMEAAYNHGDQWLDAVNDYLTANSDHVCRRLESEMPKIWHSKHEGTFLMWLDFSCCGMTSDEVTHRLAAEYGVGLGNGGRYGAGSEGFMRFNIACCRSLLDKGLDGIKAFYDKYCK